MSSSIISVFFNSSWNQNYYFKAPKGYQYEISNIHLEVRVEDSPVEDIVILDVMATNDTPPIDIANNAPIAVMALTVGNWSFNFDKPVRSKYLTIGNGTSVAPTNAEGMLFIVYDLVPLTRMEAIYEWLRGAVK